jgi:hypothetical protein
VSTVDVATGNSRHMLFHPNECVLATIFVFVGNDDKIVNIEYSAYRNVESIGNYPSPLRSQILPGFWTKQKRSNISHFHGVRAGGTARGEGLWRC